MMDTCNASIQKTVKDHFKGSLDYKGESQASLCYVERPCDKRQESLSFPSYLLSNVGNHP